MKINQITQLNIDKISKFCYKIAIFYIIYVLNYFFMDSNFIVTANNKVYCAFCTKELVSGEECHCKGSETARAKAKAKALKAEKKSPNTDANRRPPRGFSK